MFAFLVNALAVALGGILGLLLKKVIKKEICDSILKGIGIVVFIFGLAGVLRYMFVIDKDTLAISTQNDLLLIVTIVLGTLIGEIIKIDSHLEKFGIYIESKIVKSSFATGFISSTLVFCVGALAIIGSVNSGLGDPSVTYLKSMLDLVSSIVLASTLGFGVIFAAIPIIIYQGGITFLSYILGDFISAKFISGFSMVGYTLVACIGLNFIIKERIKVANMIPSLVLVIIYYLIF